MIHPFKFLVGYTRLAVPREFSADFAELFAELGVSFESEGFADMDTERGSVLCALFICYSFSERRILRSAAARGLPAFAVQRAGTPHIVSEYLLSPRRIGITLGLIFSCFLIVASGRTLWNVRVDGNQRVSDAEVISLLEQNGIVIGMPKNQIHTSIVENKIISASDDIAWISINIRGTVATVEIKESLPPPEKSDFVASNLVSNANGTVERIEGIKGNLSVGLGEPISEGQLLVGGVYDSNEFCGMRYTRARGKVFARCEKDFRVEIPLIYDKKLYTGEKKVKKTLIFFKKEIKFFPNSRNSYTNCDKIIIEEYLDPFGFGALPFGIRTTTFLEYETKSAKRDLNVALEQARLELSQQIAKSSPEYELIRKQTQTEITDSALILDCHVVCVQNVATEKEIKVDILK